MYYLDEINELKAVKDYLQRFKYIKRARRVGDNVVELLFDKDHRYIFYMTKGRIGFIYKGKSS